MADDPNTPPPGGPPGGGGNPVDPGFVDALNRMNQTLDSVDAKLKSIADSSKATVEHFKAETKVLQENMHISENIEDVRKSIVDLAKKSKKLTDDDAREIKKRLTAFAKLYDDAIHAQKESTKETKAWGKQLKEIQDILKDLPDDGKVAAVQFQKIADIIHEATINTKGLVTAMGNLGKTSASLKGLSGILASLGIGKGFNRNVERRFEQIEEVRGAVKESRGSRRAAVKKHMAGKRDKAIEQIEQMTGADFDPSSKAAVGVLASKMGFKVGHKKRDAFMAGEMAGGPRAGGETGKGWSEAMETGGGAIGGAMETFETGIETLLAGAAGLVIPLVALAGAIYGLIEVFDTYAKQNADMEKHIGKGGLFTQPGVSAGDAFMRARAGLTPNAMATGANVGMGITFERNLKLASAMAESGYNVADAFNQRGGAGATANQLPGAQGQFMQGSLGEMQRIVMGVSRVAGLGDEEGTANLIKLLQEYRETMASSEDFMNTLNKDTQAAGISTTKYLKIIENVSSHFDKMSKSLEEVTGVMRELSRYGSVSSETLKDMMEGLATAQDKTTLGSMAQSIYTNMVAPKRLNEVSTSAEAGVVDAAVDAVNKQLARPGVGGAVGQLNIGGMSSADARSAINAKRQEAMNIQDITARQNVTDALDKLSDQLLHQTTLGGDAMKQAAGGALYGEDLIQNQRKMFANLDEVVGKAGGTVQGFMEGTLTGQQTVQIQQEAAMLGLDLKKVIEPLRQEAQNRIKEATDMTETPKEQRRKLIKQLLDTIARRPNGLKTTLAGSQWDKFDSINDDLVNSMADNGDQAAVALAKNAGAIGGDIETQAHLLESMKADQRSGVKAQQDALDQAADIGKRTQTVEDILKNIFKPLFNDLLVAVEWIAKSKIFGTGFDANQEATRNDMKAIPAAMDDLDKKTADLLKSNRELNKKIEAGTATDAEKKQFEDQKKTIKENTDTLTYLGDTAAKGTVGSTADREALEKTLNDIYGYAKNGDKSPEAPSQTGSKPSFSLPFIVDPAGAIGKSIGNAIINSLGSMFGGSTINNMYSVDVANEQAKQQNVSESSENTTGSPMVSP